MSILSTAVKADTECVVLLHGWGQFSNVMEKLETRLTQAGYVVAAPEYTTRQHTIGDLTRIALEPGIATCRNQNARSIHFLTHSLGGILVRYYLETETVRDLGRVVMVAPPNQGIELVNLLQRIPGFDYFGGPAVAGLGTGESSVVDKLGPVNFELGVIAGDTNLNPLNILIGFGPSDSVVSVASTRVEGMSDHLTLPVSHSMMMWDKDVLDQAIHYLKTGSFYH